MKLDGWDRLSPAHWTLFAMLISLYGCATQPSASEPVEVPGFLLNVADHIPADGLPLAPRLVIDNATVELRSVDRRERPSGPGNLGGVCNHLMVLPFCVGAAIVALPVVALTRATDGSDNKSNERYAFREPPRGRYADIATLSAKHITSAKLRTAFSKSALPSGAESPDYPRLVVRLAYVDQVRPHHGTVDIAIRAEAQAFLTPDKEMEPSRHSVHLRRYIVRDLTDERLVGELDAAIEALAQSIANIYLPAALKR